MTRFHEYCAVVLFAVIAACLSQAAHSAEPPTKPNVIVILIDDMGWTDLSCQGSKFYETPNIDRLATEGMRFTNGYATCTVCSPTRAALLTGQYPARLHVTDWIEGHKRPKAKLAVPDWTMHLPLKTTTLAEAFRQAGYATAHVGKWHLGDEPFWPKNQGFQVNIGGNHRGQPPAYFFPYERKGIKLPGLEQGKENEYLTDRLTDESIAWIEKHRDEPFFLYLAHYAVHTPLQAKPELIEKYTAKADPNQPQHNATYAAMIDSLDQGVGRLMDKLRDWKLDERTIVVFTSDNGGLALNNVTSNAPLRAGKGSAYEGGVRVPWIVRYPPLIKAGTTCDEPVITVDLFPTLLDLAGVKHKQREPLPLDGQSIAPLLRQQGDFEAKALYWHYPHYHPGGASPYGAIRLGDYRLVEFYEDGKVELYNLRDDIGEQNDLAAKMPKKRDELLANLRAWRERVGAQMPTPNPDYDPNYTPTKGKKKKA